jgi:peptide/nickel transport system permease protein
MLSYLLRRLGFLALTIIVTSLMIFTIAQVLPGDVARIILGREASEAALANLRRDLGLDRPLMVQYLDWLVGFVIGDWGMSYSTSQPIRPLVAERLGNTLMLAGLTLAIAVPLAIALGVLAALREDGWLDTLISLFSLSVVGLPEFVTGLVLIQIFSFGLGWLPANASIRTGSTFWQALPFLVLPALTATLVLLAYIARLTRASTIEELKKPYVRTARLKGTPYALVLWRHVLPNALLPTITVIAISFGWLISGLIVVENVFNYPGLGRLLTFAIDRRDLPLLQAVTFVTVVAFALSNLLADVLYALLNPRIKLTGE